MNKNDARVIVTKEMFHRAMLSLLEKQAIGTITVKELCLQAGLNRGTFYLHYESPYDVLKEIENRFIEQNMQFFDSYWNTDRELDYMQQLFTCIFQNQDICRVLMGDNGDPQFMSSLKYLVRDGIVDEWQKEFPSYDREKLVFLFDYVFSGSMRLILDWINDSEHVSIQAFTHRLERLGHYSLVAAGEF